MKKLVLSFLLSAASTAFAAEPMQIKGKDADALLNALTLAGSQTDCGAGTCGTTVTDVGCAKIKFKKGGPECWLKLQTSTGDHVKRTLTGKRAVKLLNALIKVDIGGCAMESCEGWANSIDCTFSNVSEEDDSTQCTVK